MPLMTVTVACEATRAGGQELTYVWSVAGGELRGEGPEVQWQAPPDEGLHRVTVVVAGRDGGSATSSVALPVRANIAPEILSLQPVIEAGVDLFVPGAEIEIQCEAVDVEGDGLKYQWAASAGQISGSGPLVTWTAPQTLGTHFIEVQVSDPHGGVAEHAIPLAINAARPPDIGGFSLKLIEADLFGRYGRSWRIFKEGTCAIEILVDEQDSAYSYEWTADAGQIVAEGRIAVWRAPSVAGWVAIVVQVSDAHGNRASDSLRILVETCAVCG